MTALPDRIADEEQLEDLLSRPTPAVVEALGRLTGDLLVLGAAGKMGPTLCRMARRAFDQLPGNRRVMAAARFSDPAVARNLQDRGVETVKCDLLDPESVQQLPHAPLVIYMAGQKFGTAGDPARTWAMNALAPAHAAETFSGSRMVVFSTGCVYPLQPAAAGGSREGDPLEPLGEYSNSCVARERIVQYFSGKGLQAILMRLNYAVELRYGVLLDIARKVYGGRPVDLSMGYANVIWQGDANALALQMLEHTASPAAVLNITGPEILSIRSLAHRFGEWMDCTPMLVGEEAPTALLSDASRSFGLFGYPTVPVDRVIQWTATWIRSGGPTWDRPTHFEVRDGRF